MKIWPGYGSEHSANLVMIGEFKTAVEAKSALRAIERIQQRVLDDVQPTNNPESESSIADDLWDILRDLKIYTLGPSDLQQFAFDYSFAVEGTRLRLTTDEVDVAAFMKLMIERGARIEIFSRHDYPETD